MSQQWNDDTLAEALKVSSTMTQVLTHLGYATPGGRSRQAMLQRVAELGLSLGVPYVSPKRVGELGTDNRNIKRNLVRERGHKCETCGTSEWMGQSVPLNLHHKTNKDNVRDNLLLLCPNCHHQTENFTGKLNGKRGETA